MNSPQVFGGSRVRPTSVAIEPVPTRRHSPMKLPFYEKPEHDPFYVMLGRVVTERRKKLGLTQEGLAEAADISRAEVQFVENAKRRVKLDTVRRCCMALAGLWLAELFMEVQRRLVED